MVKFLKTWNDKLFVDIIKSIDKSIKTSITNVGCYFEREKYTHIFGVRYGKLLFPLHFPR